MMARCKVGIELLCNINISLFEVHPPTNRINMVYLP